MSNLMVMSSEPARASFWAPGPSARPARRARPLGICLISEEFPPETGWGGIGTYTSNLARGLAAMGQRVHVIARCWGADRVEHVDGVVVHRLALPEPSWRWGTWFINIRFPELREIVLWNRLVARRVRELREHGEGIDIIESPEYHAQGLATTLSDSNVPMIVRLHTPAFLCRRLNGAGIGGGPADVYLSEQAEYRLARRARVITSPSYSMAAEVARQWGVDLSRIRIVPNPIDEETFAAGDDPARQKRSIVFVGRLERRKGVDLIIEALPAVLREFPDAQVTFIGNDHPSGPGGTSMQDHLLARVRELGIRETAVRFAGQIERTKLPAHLRRTEICVVPSRYESFGYTCVEAMAAGCAVVAANAGALPEIVSDGVDGLLFRSEDAASLAGAMLRLLRDESLRRRVAQRAVQTVAERFSCRAVCEEMLALYRRSVLV